MQNNVPIDKGRVAVIAEKYQSNQVDQQTGQPMVKNRYATVGRATLWPNKPGSNMPNMEIEIDTMPVNYGGNGPVKMYVFWDSENQNNQQPQQQPPQQNSYPQNGGYGDQRR